MRYLLVVLIVFASSAQAQIFGGDDGGQRWHRYEGMRYREYADLRRQHYVRRHHRRHRHLRHVRDEGRVWRDRETQSGYANWRAPEKDEAYRGWWRPEGGWRDSDGHRRCRPPMHAAGGADARSEAARNAAIKAWQEQVINEHGERFLSFEAAYVIDEHCDPARVGEGAIIELKRCIVTAAPCLTLREGERRRGDEERPQ